MSTPLVQQAFTFKEVFPKFFGYPQYIIYWDQHGQIFKSHRRIGLWYLSTYVIFAFYLITVCATYTASKIRKLKIDIMHFPIFLLYTLDMLISGGMYFNVVGIRQELACYLNVLTLFQSRYLNLRMNSRIDWHQIKQGLSKILLLNQ